MAGVVAVAVAARSQSVDGAKQLQCNDFLWVDLGLQLNLHNLHNRTSTPHLVTFMRCRP